MAKILATFCASPSPDVRPIFPTLSGSPTEVAPRHVPRAYRGGHRRCFGHVWSVHGSASAARQAIVEKSEDCDPRDLIAVPQHLGRLRHSHPKLLTMRPPPPGSRRVACARVSWRRAQGNGSGAGLRARRARTAPHQAHAGARGGRRGHRRRHAQAQAGSGAGSRRQAQFGASKGRRRQATATAQRSAPICTGGQVDGAPAAPPPLVHERHEMPLRLPLRRVAWGAQRRRLATFLRGRSAAPEWSPSTDARGRGHRRACGRAVQRLGVRAGGRRLERRRQNHPQTNPAFAAFWLRLWTPTRSPGLLSGSSAPGGGVWLRIANQIGGGDAGRSWERGGGAERLMGEGAGGRWG